MFGILEEAKNILELQAKELNRVKNRLDRNFEKAVETILNCKGKVVVTGMGKSGLVGRKIAATMSSTGTLAIFLHPAEGAHGDLGMVDKKDVVLAISHSGNTEEVLRLMPPLRKIGVKIIAIVGDLDSQLAKEADIVIDSGVEREADPYNLAPTTSTTISLALGDALAIVLAKLKGFKPEDFGLLHPGGMIGKRLLLKVDDLMHTGEKNPIIDVNSSMEEILNKLIYTRLGAVSVVRDNKLVGIITDGDLKRILRSSKERFFSLKAKDIMTKNPIWISTGSKAIEALRLMEDRESEISELPVVNEKMEVMGLLRLHDLVKIGLSNKKRNKR
jgi:arabinose-5-phosphate isomerase